MYHGLLVGLLTLTAQLVVGLLASDIPNCNYTDTVDLSHSERCDNGSYEYEGILVESSLTGSYDYELQYCGERNTVAAHMRGCVCRDNVCIRLCCPQLQDELIKSENRCSSRHAAYSTVDASNIFLNIVQADGSVLNTDLNSSGMLIQYGLPVPCADHQLVISSENGSQPWHLHENGDLLLHNVTLSREVYCLQPNPVDQYTYALMLYTCPAPRTLFQRVKSYVQLISIFFLVLTITLYILLPNLRTVHGKCLMCYFSSLLVAYAMLNLDSWNMLEAPLMCLLSGYIGYFAIMAALLWLAVINMGLWQTFGRNSFGLLSKNRQCFKIYSLFAWGIAGLLVFLVIIADGLVTSEWKPGVAIYSSERASAFVYFYGPMLVLLVFNTIMFIVTAQSFHNENRKNKTVLRKEAAQLKKDMASNMREYCIILRLFILMGISWLLEIFSRIFGNEDYKDDSMNMLNIVFSSADLLNSGQGAIAFIETALKPNVYQILAQRFRKKKPAQSPLSTTLEHTF